MTAPSSQRPEGPIERRRTPDLPGVAEPEPLPACGAMRVLLIEDDPVDAFLTRSHLDEVVGVHVEHVTTLHEAVEVAREGRVDVVLSDLHLPDAAGLDAVNALVTAVSGLPVIVLTGSDDENAAVEAVRRGAQDYLVKDAIDARILGRALRYAVERKRTEARLAYLALHDNVTGLHNRVAFREALARGLGGDVGVGVLYVDLDRFKAINDHFGHDAGDQLLREVGNRLRRAVRANDVVARIGGDEFAIVALDVRAEEELWAIGERLVAEFQPPIFLDGDPIHVTCSVGGALYPACGETVDDLVTAADRAMYRAKSLGRNRVHVADGAVEKEPVPAMHIERELFGALESDQFRLHYQPQVRARTGEIVGFEALLRWTHPTLGPQRPDRFVGMLEDTGLIRVVGAWVLRTALAWIARYREVHGTDARIAVNVSASQLADEELSTVVARALDATGVPPGALELEFTEATMMRDLERTERQVEQLRALGVRLALDDFGTGFSSLSHLRRFRVDTVKIDRSFLVDPGDIHLVSAIIGLGRRLGLAVVAEGVETEAQRRFLVEDGCEILQGYLLGRPAPGETFLAR